MTSIASSSSAKSRRTLRLPDGRTAIAFGLHLSRFLLSTMLLSWGVFALGFLLLGGGSLDGMMHQLDNLARRYVEADAAREGPDPAWRAARPGRDRRDTCRMLFRGDTTPRRI